MTQDRVRGTVEIPPSCLDLPEGWLSDAEVAYLQEQCADRLVLEVGAWVGRSTVAIARVAAVVVSVDHHVLSGGSSLPRLLANLDAYGVRDRVVPVVADFRLAAPALKHRHFEVAFIDGAHDTLSVIHDARAAAALLRAGSPVIFHDHANDTGVASAVSELERRWQRRARLVPDTSMAVLTSP